MGFFKKKKEENYTMTLPPDFGQDNYEQGDLIGNAFNQQVQQPNIPQQNTPLQAPNNQYLPSIMNRPVRQAPQFQPLSRILTSGMLDQGEYIYVVATNYPLNLGDCQLLQ